VTGRPTEPARRRAPGDDALDRLAAVAGGAEPPPMDSDRARVLLDQAVAAGVAESGIRRRSGGDDPLLRTLPGLRSERRGLAAAAPWVAAAASVLLAAGAGWWARGVADPADGPEGGRVVAGAGTGAAGARGTAAAPTEGGPPEPDETPTSDALIARLPSGDRVAATPGARFDLLDTGPHRRARVTRGTVLFDVATLDGDGSFVVEAGAYEVVVRGTVFSVTRADDDGDGAPEVRVYEGVVEVRRGADGPATRLTRAEVWRGEAAATTAAPGPLAELGRAAAAARAPAAPTDDVGPLEGPGDPAADARTTGASPAPRGGGARTPRGDPTPDVATVRRWIAEGRADRALATARRQVAAGGGAVWQEVVGDALRAQGRPADAARAYETAAEALPRNAAVRAAYLAAALHFRDLDQPAEAVRVLDGFRADAVGSPLEERALGLRARALLAAGRDADARRAAARYLDRYPDGGLAEWARKLGAD